MQDTGKTFVPRQQRRQAARAKFAQQKKIQGGSPLGGVRQRKNRTRINRQVQSANGFETLVQAKGDPRNGKQIVSPVAANVQNTVTISVQTQNSNIVYFAAGYVTKALEKGYQGSQTNNLNSYWAYVYLVRILQQFASGGQPQVQKLPYVVLAFGRAITQKAVGMDNGKVTYSFQVGSVADPSGGGLLMGSSVFGNSWQIGYVPPSPTLVNGFPALLSPSTAPTEEQAANAFSEMNLFLQKRFQGNDRTSPFRFVSLDQKTTLDRDVSAFSVGTSVVGGGSAGGVAGGFMQVSQLEVPIFRPFLSVFNVLPPQVSVDQNRWGNLNVTASGDPTYIGAMIGHVFRERDWSYKRPAKFHCVDFNEFVETLAMWVQAVLQAAMNDPTGQWANAADTYACPLTLQEMMLLLRNVMMCAFKDTQAGVQGLYPFNPLSSLDNQFQPFTAGSGTCFLEAIDMKLPLPFVENIRSLVMRETRRHPKDPEFFVPVLGANFLDVMSSASYTFTPPVSSPNPAPVPVPCFASGALFQQKVKSKDGSSNWVDVAEAQISMFDGLAPGQYLAINNPMQLKHLAMQWNNWIAQNGLTNYSSTLTTFGTETGTGLLSSINLTRHYIVGGGGAKSNKKSGSGKFEPVPEKDVRDKRMGQRKWDSVAASPYLNRLMVADTTQSVPLQVPYEQIQVTWILPTIVNEFQADTQSTLVPRWQSLMKEPFLLNATSGFDGVSLAAMHSAYANKMVKGRQEGANDWERFFHTADEKGEGGILSGLLGNVLGGLFPAAASTINSIASVIPI